MKKEYPLFVLGLIVCFVIGLLLGGVFLQDRSRRVGRERTRPVTLSGRW